MGLCCLTVLNKNLFYHSKKCSIFLNKPTLLNNWIKQGFPQIQQKHMPADYRP